MSIWFFRRDRFGRRKFYTVSFPCLTTTVMILGFTISAVFHFARASFAEQLGTLIALGIALTLVVLLVVWNRRRERRDHSQDAERNRHD